MREDEKHHIPKLVEIMQDVFKDHCYVPIVSEPEYTDTSWSKSDVKEWVG